MGVESKLRGRASSPKVSTSSHASYENGDKKLINRSSCPAGCDEFIWHLGMYYRDAAIALGYDAERMPVVYTEIYERVLTDRDLSGILDDSYSDSRAYARDTHGMEGTTLVTVVEEMIDRYFNHYDNYKAPSIDNFCSTTVFEENKALIISKHKNDLLKKSAVKVPQVLPHAMPTRRTAEQDEAARIKFRKPGDEEDCWSRARNFVTAYKEG